MIFSQMILKKCFITKFHFSGVQNQLDEFTNFIDIAYYFWIITPKLLENLKGLNEKLISHILDILQKIPIPSENELKDLTEDLLFCFTKSTLIFILIFQNNYFYFKSIM